MTRPLERPFHRTRVMSLTPLRAALAALAVLGIAACNSDTITPPAVVSIDCSTLATSLATSDSTLTTTASGLKYRDQTAGTGLTAQTGTLVALNYSGCLTDGTKFTEVTNTDPPTVFQIGDSTIIAGFNEGLVGMKVGGQRQLVIPPALAWGTAGAYDQYGRVVVPPNATVVFTIDLVQAQ
jgi:FKBP-type peptidyl-prolyl cis-trans isomerase